MSSVTIQFCMVPGTYELGRHLRHLCYINMYCVTTARIHSGKLYYYYYNYYYDLLVASAVACAALDAIVQQTPDNEKRLATRSLLKYIAKI